MGTSLTDVFIQWGARTYVFGAMRIGLLTQKTIPHDQFQGLRSAFRSKWQTNDLTGAISFSGTFADGSEMTLIAGFSNTAGIRPFSAYDGFNGQLAPGILERLYWYMLFTGSCNVQVDVLNPSVNDVLLFTIQLSAAPC
jgi:hypothetical protein